MQFEIGNNEIYLNNEKNEKIAFVCFEKLNDNVYNIYHTYVDESMRGKGIAKEILGFTVKYLKEKGAVKIEATCSFAAHLLEKNATR